MADFRQFINDPRLQETANLRPLQNGFTGHNLQFAKAPTTTFSKEELAASKQGGGTGDAMDEILNIFGLGSTGAKPSNFTESANANPITGRVPQQSAAPQGPSIFDPNGFMNQATGLPPEQSMVNPAEGNGGSDITKLLSMFFGG